MTTGIPTLFKGVQFRSRLEAKWAAFFDNMEWRWEYEPVDREGWIPDFAIWLKGQDALLVDVKPCLNWDDFRKRGREVLELAPGSRVLIVGATLSEPDDCLDQVIGPTIGWITVPELSPTALGPAHLSRLPDGRLVIFNADAAKYHDWDTSNLRVEIDWAWREAGNLVQWVARNTKDRSVNGSAPEGIRQ